MAIRDLIRRKERHVPARRDMEDTSVFAFQRDVNRLFDEFFRGFDLTPFSDGDRAPSAFFAPKVNVSETDKEVMVSAELPGLDEKNVTVEVEDDTLVIRGERSDEREDKGRNWHCVEHTYGSFHRAIPLPARVDDTKAKAQFKKGILTVTLPKAPEEVARRKAIDITAD